MFPSPNATAASEAASALDRAFFSVNPRRSTYVREALVDEFGPFEAPDDHKLLVFVSKVGAGLRTRQFRSAATKRAAKILKMPESRLQRQLDALAGTSWVAFVGGGRDA